MQVRISNVAVNIKYVAKKSSTGNTNVDNFTSRYYRHLYQTTNKVSFPPRHFPSDNCSWLIPPPPQTISTLEYYQLQQVPLRQLPLPENLKLSGGWQLPRVRVVHSGNCPGESSHEHCRHTTSELFVRSLTIDP